MAPRKSPIWQYYSEDPDNPTNALCLVPGCTKSKLSRGKDGSSKTDLSVSPLASHLRRCHHKEYKDYLLSKNSIDGIKQTGLVEELEETEHLYASETYKSGLIETFEKLYKRNILTDVTLVTEDHIKIQAHKIVLCAGSEFFNDFLVGSSCSGNTLMFLRGVTESVLRPLLEFLYLGETRVQQKSLDDFVKIAHDLKISALGKEDQINSEGTEEHLMEDDIKTEDVTTDIVEPNVVEAPEINPIGYNLLGQPVYQQEDHGNMEYNGQMHPCPLCGKVMKGTSLGLHIRSIHDKMQFKCDHCSFEAKRKYRLKDHLVSVHSIGENEQTRGCPWCGKVMKTTSLSLHISSFHKKTKFKCEHCSFEAKRKDALKDHLMNAHSIGYKFICDFSGCNFKTTRPSRLANHKYQFHFQKQEGETVSFELAETSKVSDKMETSGTNDKYKCDLPRCAFIASNPGELMEHKFSTHRG